eukprot:gene24248-9845_t
MTDTELASRFNLSSILRRFLLCARPTVVTPLDEDTSDLESVADGPKPADSNTKSYSSCGRRHTDSDKQSLSDQLRRSSFSDCTRRCESDQKSSSQITFTNIERRSDSHVSDEGKFPHHRCDSRRPTDNSIDHSDQDLSLFVGENERPPGIISPELVNPPKLNVCLAPASPKLNVCIAATSPKLNVCIAVNPPKLNVCIATNFAAPQDPWVKSGLHSPTGQALLPVSISGWDSTDLINRYDITGTESQVFAAQHVSSQPCVPAVPISG